MRKHLAKHTRTLGAHSPHIEPLVGLGAQDCRNAAESIEQCPCGGDGDARHCSQDCLGGWVTNGRFGALRVQRSLCRGFVALTPNREPVKPAGAITLMIAADECNAEVDRGETGASNRVRMERPAIEICALDEKVRERARVTELPDLRPEVPLRDGAVEVENALPLDDRVHSDEVVAGDEGRAFDDSAKILEQQRDAALLLMHIGNDGYYCHHKASVPYLSHSRRECE